ncbi:hypothetical protein PR202_ga20013 [Eleusine coracana subsp. coracana]|uniref:Pre-rRNA-processing protein Ipi1 N-terminal domain-containing protein n=1 Tax=Eleusine coracana subsp. coracana TaxID=191504 RepID=A0AAV5CWX1_ELECO|nr:hypothetical protein PR202_ga20013 [Eleusine coracana subsp. coracana]
MDLFWSCGPSYIATLAAALLVARLIAPCGCRLPAACAAAAFPSPSALPSERARAAQNHDNTGAMGRPKGVGASASSSSKKQKAKPKQRGGVDFKKYKHKVGRKLPPPKNATNTEIKFKAIVLPEQSMASERAGMAVNKRGLTLRELLQQTGHYNANVRRAALNGIKDIVVKHPTELKLHKVAIIEKLQERICDSDKVVRESLYSLLQSQIIPSLKQLMAFRFLELVVLNFPSSFTSYSEQAFDNFIAVLSNDRIQLHDRNKLNSVLSGLGHCLSLVAKTSNIGDTSNRQDHLHHPNLLAKLQNLVQILINSTEVSASEFCAKSAIDAQSSEALLSALHCLDLICRIFVHELKKPQLNFSISKTQFDSDSLRSSLLVHLKNLWGVKRVKRLFHEKAKTHRNKDLVEIYLSPLITALPGLISNAPDDSKGYLLEAFTDAFRDCKVDCKLILPYLDAVGEMLLDVASSGLMELGPFVNLPRDCQELAISCLYYFPSMLPDINRAIGLVLLKVAEILQSIYKAGHLPITEQLSFLLLLMARFKVHPGTSKVLNEDIIKLIAGYLVDASLDLSKTIETGFQPDKTRLFQYFIKPCIIMFEKNDKVFCSTLELLKSFVTGDDYLFSSPSNLNYPKELSCRVCVVTTILIFLCNDQKLHRNLSLNKLVIKGILEYISHQLVSYVK